MEGGAMAKFGDDLGKLLLRVTVGGLMLFHGAFKLTHGIDFITGMLQAAHLPVFLGYGVYVGEVVGPILILLGLWARAGGLFVAADMVVALALTKSGEAFAVSPQSGGLSGELELLYLAGGLAIALVGAGAFSVSRGKGAWN
jgi:putative oxidoreductase